MINSYERKTYWRHTKWRCIYALIPLFVAILGIPFYADPLNHNKFLGFPLGYFLAAHGIILLSIITIVSFVNRQDAVDRWHGTHEDL